MSLLEIVLSIFMACINMFSMYCISINSRSEKKKISILEFIFILIMAIIIDCLNINSIALLVLSYLLIILSFFVFDKKNFKKDIITYFLLYIYGIIVELIILVVLKLLLNISPTTLSFYFRQLISFAFMIIWFISWYKIYNILKISVFVDKLEIIIKKFFIIECLCIMFFVSLTIVFLNYFYEKINIFVVSSFAFIIIILFAILIICLKSIFLKKRLETNNEALELLLKQYEQIVDDYKEIRHNILSDFLVIKSKANEECAELIDYKIADYYKNYQWINEISKVPKGLQGIIYAKNIIAQKQKVKIFVKSKSSLDKFDVNLSIKKYNDLYKAVSLLLDNAIEGAAKSKDKVIILDVEIKKNTIKIMMCNCYNNSIDLDKIGKKGYSTKGSNHGIGLNYIKNKISKEIDIRNIIINDVFVVEIRLNIKKPIKASLLK